MCVEIHYLYHSCSCLARVGKYACYSARTSCPTTSTTSNITNAANGTSANSGTASLRNPFSNDNALSRPNITITSTCGTTEVLALYTEHPFSTFKTAPLSLPLSNNNHDDKTAKFTIRTLLSNRVENINQIDYLETSKFNVHCEHFKVTEQVMRLGMHACRRCLKSIEREELEKEQIYQARLKAEEEEEGKRVWEMVQDDMEVVRKRGSPNNKTLLSGIGGLGSKDTQGKGGQRGLLNMDEVERELREIQLYANSVAVEREWGDEEEKGRESWESVDDEEEMELLIATAVVKRPGSSLWRRRSNSQ